MTVVLLFFLQVKNPIISITEYPIMNNPTILKGNPFISASAIPPPLMGFTRISASKIFTPNPIIPANVGDFVFPWA